MQIISLHALTFLGTCLGASAASLRARAGRADQLNLAVSSVSANSLQDKAPEVEDYEVIKKESIKRKGSADCLCKMGEFWHWRIKSCVKQGGWGYECGFFPAEHHDKVCRDGLKCEPLNQTKTKYVHPGAVPASCKACGQEDKCLSGKERHKQSCLKEYKLSGSACQTVRVSVAVTASAQATEKVTKSSSASAVATATASQTATATKDGETASAKKKVTAEGQATATAKASSEASAKAKATEKTSAEGKGCISVKEVKKLMKIEDVPRIGAVLSAEVVARGDKEAFHLAHANALKAAVKAGLISAQDAAKAIAAARASEDAGRNAEAKADEAAAWKAEAGAEKAAQDKAKAEALAKAQAAANKDAATAATAASKAAAKAEAAEKAAQAAEKNAKDQAAAAAKEEAKAKAEAAARAKEEADAAAKAAAAAKHASDLISDVVNSRPQEPPARPTTPEPTSPPRKITPAQIAAKLP